MSYHCYRHEIDHPSDVCPRCAAEERHEELADLAREAERESERRHREEREWAEDRQREAEEFQEDVLYKQANPGEYDCPGCGFRTLKRGYRRCSKCGNDAGPDYWPAVLAREEAEAERRRAQEARAKAEWERGRPERERKEAEARERAAAEALRREESATAEALRLAAEERSRSRTSLLFRFVGVTAGLGLAWLLLSSLLSSSVRPVGSVASTPAVASGAVPAETEAEQTPDDRLILHLRCCGEKDVALVERLLAAGADPNALDYYNALPALGLAIEQDLVEIAGLLIARGAKVNAKSMSSGRFPLIFLATSVPMMKLLIEHGADPGATNVSGATALHEHARATPAQVELLVSSGWLADAKDKNGATPLSLAEERRAAIESAMTHASAAERPDLEAGLRGIDATIALLRGRGGS